MGRLTEYTGHGYVAYDPIDTKYDFSEINLQKLIDKLAHYEDLEEAGRLVVLPCKAGDTVREVDKPLGIIAEWRVTEFVIHEDVVFAENPYLGEYCDIKEFGKTVFLTREEAEAALKGAE